MKPNEFEHFELQYLEGVYKEMKNFDEGTAEARRQEFQKFLEFMEN